MRDIELLPPGVLTLCHQLQEGSQTSPVLRPQGRLRENKEAACGHTAVMASAGFILRQGPAVPSQGGGFSEGPPSRGRRQARPASEGLTPVRGEQGLGPAAHRWDTSGQWEEDREWAGRDPFLSSPSHPNPGTASPPPSPLRLPLSFSCRPGGGERRGGEREQRLGRKYLLRCLGTAKTEGWVYVNAACLHSPELWISELEGVSS